MDAANPLTAPASRVLHAAGARLQQGLPALDPQAPDQPILSFIEIAPLGISMQHLGRLLYVNPYLARLLGRERPSVLGRSFGDLVHRDHQSSAAADLARLRDAGGPLFDVEFAFLHEGGEKVWARGSMVRVERDGDMLDFSLLVDTTESKRATRELESANEQLRTLQRRLIQVERLGAARDLAGTVAHSIGNPLAALLGSVAMAREEKDEDPVLERVEGLARRIDSVVQRTLSFCREDSLDLRPESPESIVSRLRDDLAERASPTNVKVEVECASGLPVLSVDRELLVSALIGIGENAVDAMPHGGLLRIQVARTPRSNVVAFVFDDTGPGIPSRLLGRVLEPFFTSKSAGTGLGLAIANGVVRAHGGRIDVGEGPGGGARFSVELPIADWPAPGLRPG